jgi:hypothetical protein
MSTISDRTGLYVDQMQKMDLTSAKRFNIAEAPDELYNNYIRAQENFLEARYTKINADPNSARNQPYATIKVNGQTVATIDNNGYVESSGAIGSRLHTLLAEEGGPRPGPGLAEDRAAKIAQLLGGSVEKASTALTQSAYQSSTANSLSVNYDAMREDDAYQQLQEIKRARTLFLAQQNGQETGTTHTSTSPGGYSNVVLNTTRGTQAMDLESLFNPKPASGPISIDNMPIILPTADNIKALTDHAQKAFGDLLSQYNIPEAPREISYDGEGKPVFPADYAYKDELKQALDETPVIQRELQTIAALTSHYAGMVGQASTSNTPKITLNFDQNGNLSVKTNGKNFEQPSASESQQASQSYDKRTERSEAEKWFMDYMEKTPEERLFEAILRDKGLTPEEFEALPVEERQKIEQEIQEEMEEKTLNEIRAGQNGKTEQFA